MNLTQRCPKCEGRKEVKEWREDPDNNIWYAESTDYDGAKLVTVACDECQGYGFVFNDE